MEMGGSKEVVRNRSDQKKKPRPRVANMQLATLGRGKTKYIANIAKQKTFE
jgi:hypothetical protein